MLETAQTLRSKHLARVLLPTSEVSHCECEGLFPCSSFGGVSQIGQCLPGRQHRWTDQGSYIKAGHRVPVSLVSGRHLGGWCYTVTNKMEYTKFISTVSELAPVKICVPQGFLFILYIHHMKKCLERNIYLHLNTDGMIMTSQVTARNE